MAASGFAHTTLINIGRGAFARPNKSGTARRVLLEFRVSPLGEGACLEEQAGGNLDPIDMADPSCRLGAMDIIAEGLQAR